MFRLSDSNGNEIKLFMRLLTKVNANR